MLTPSPQVYLQLRCGGAGASCDPATGAVSGTPFVCGDGHVVPGSAQWLACDPFERACAAPCTVNSDCAAAGLPGHVCDRRIASAYFGARSLVPPELSPDDEHRFCVTAFCP